MKSDAQRYLEMLSPDELAIYHGGTVYPKPARTLRDRVAEVRAYWIDSGIEAAIARMRRMYEQQAQAKLRRKFATVQRREAA